MPKYNPKARLDTKYIRDRMPPKERAQRARTHRRAAIGRRYNWSAGRASNQRRIFQRRFQGGSKGLRTNTRRTRTQWKTLRQRDIKNSTWNYEKRPGLKRRFKKTDWQGPRGDRFKAAPRNVWPKWHKLMMNYLLSLVIHTGLQKNLKNPLWLVQLRVTEFIHEMI